MRKFSSPRNYQTLAQIFVSDSDCLHVFLKQIHNTDLYLRVAINIRHNFDVISAIRLSLELLQALYQPVVSEVSEVLDIGFGRSENLSLTFKKKGYKVFLVNLVDGAKFKRDNKV